MSFLIDPYRFGTAIPTANLKHYYKLNANVLDSVGISTGTATDITYTSGKTGNAATFNGTTSKISFPANLWSSPTELSVTGFVKVDNTSAEYRLVAFNNNTNGAFILHRVNTSSTAGRIQSQVNNDTSVDAVIDDSKTITNWVHFIITAKESSSMKLYLDGVLSGTDSSFGNFVQVATNGNYIGCARSGSSHFLPGQMYAVGMWDVELTAAEALAVYNKQNSGSHLV